MLKYLFIWSLLWLALGIAGIILKNDAMFVLGMVLSGVHNVGAIVIVGVAKLLKEQEVKL